MTRRSPPPASPRCSIRSASAWTNTRTAQAASASRSCRSPTRSSARATPDLLRADHLTHLRCEIPAPNVVEFLEDFLARHPARLDLADGPHARPAPVPRSREVFHLLRRQDRTIRATSSPRSCASASGSARERAEANRPRIVALAHAHGITLASHDDTTLEDVEQAKRDGVHIAEFPTTLRGRRRFARGRHGDGDGRAQCRARRLAFGQRLGARIRRSGPELDILSSDYVPAALLMAAFRLADAPDVGGLPGAMRMVTKNPPKRRACRSRRDRRRPPRRSAARARSSTASRWCARCGARAGGSRERALAKAAPAAVRRHRRPERRRQGRADPRPRRRLGEGDGDLRRAPRRHPPRRRLRGSRHARGRGVRGGARRRALRARLERARPPLRRAARDRGAARRRPRRSSATFRAAMVAEARRRYRPSLVVLVTARPETLAARLAARGRDDGASRRAAARAQRRRRSRLRARRDDRQRRRARRGGGAALRPRRRWPAERRFVMTPRATPSISRRRPKAPCGVSAARVARPRRGERRSATRLCARRIRRCGVARR